MAKGVIGNLRVNMGLDSAQFQAGIQQAQGSAEKFAQALKTTMVAAGAAASAALAAVTVAVKRTISSANDLGYVADRLGVNIERLQELRYAAERGGMGVQNFDVALRRFIRRAAEAANGTGAAKNAFKELGVTLRDTSGHLKPSETLLNEVADAMQRVPNSADKLRIAFQMFDTDGAAMVNVLANGSEGMKELAAEAQRLGLVLSEDTVRAAQAITNNFDMVGSIIGGVVNQLTSYLAPALVLVSEGAVWLALKFSELISVLPVVAEYTMVAGGALAVMAGPAILASIGSLAMAIGTGLVGAVKLLTAAIMANPLGALAVGIAAAVTAAYHFRDEIQKAIGVDVVGIVKATANYLINSFRAAYEDVKFIWSNFGNIMGAAVIGGVNAAIRGLNALVQKAAEGIDWLIEKINKIPGVSISLIGDVEPIMEIANTYFDQIEGALNEHNAKIQKIMSEDAIGALGEALTLSMPAIQDFATGLASANEQITGAGKGSEAAREKMLTSLDQLRQSLMTAEEAERNSYAQRLLDIQEFNDAKLIGEAEYHDLMERAKQEHADRMIEIERRRVDEEQRIRDMTLGGVASTLGSIGRLIEASGEKGLAAAKAFAIGEAIVNTAVGITQALRLPPPASWAQAAAVAAAGAAQIAAITSARKGGGSRPSVKSSGGVSSSAIGDSSSPSPQQAMTINLQGDVYSRQSIEDLINEINQAQRDGYAIIHVGG